MYLQLTIIYAAQVYNTCYFVCMVEKQKHHWLYDALLHHITSAQPVHHDTIASLLDSTNAPLHNCTIAPGLAWHLLLTLSSLAPCICLLLQPTCASPFMGTRISKPNLLIDAISIYRCMWIRTNFDFTQLLFPCFSRL